MSVYVTKETLFHCGQLHFETLGLPPDCNPIDYTESQRQDFAIVSAIWNLQERFGRRDMGSSPEKVIASAIKLLKESIGKRQFRIRHETKPAAAQLQHKRIEREQKLISILKEYALDTLETPGHYHGPVLRRLTLRERLNDILVRFGKGGSSYLFS